MKTIADLTFDDLRRIGRDAAENAVADLRAAGVFGVASGSVRRVDTNGRCSDLAECTGIRVAIVDDGISSIGPHRVRAVQDMLVAARPGISQRTAVGKERVRKTRLRDTEGVVVETRPLDAEEATKLD